MGDSQRPQDDEATRGLTLRELVLEVRTATSSIATKLDAHLLSHAEADAQHRGEARVLGIARSTIAMAVSAGAGLISILVALHVIA